MDFHGFSLIFNGFQWHTIHTFPASWHGSVDFRPPGPGPVNAELQRSGTAEEAAISRKKINLG